MNKDEQIYWMENLAEMFIRCFNFFRGLVADIGLFVLSAAKILEGIIGGSDG